MIDDLYREVIIDHNKNPRNFGEPSSYTHDGSEHNRLCGDKIHLWISIHDDTIDDMQFHGSGCALSIASASIMTETIKGSKIYEAVELFNRFHDMLVGNEEPEEMDEKLSVFSGVKEFPVRVKCVTMVWHILKNILDSMENKDE
jgi:nitrogen fixation protein NifU and related proteins